MALEIKKQRRKMYAFIFTPIVIFSSFLPACKKDAKVRPLDSSNPSAPSSGSLATTSLNSTTGILHELWTNTSGNDVSEIPLTTTANTTEVINTLELPNSYTANTSDRIRGYITAPATGKYTFWISGDDAAQLWLSTNSDPANAVQVASFLSWTNFRQWDKFSSQQSAQISLTAGFKYYIEVLHKQGGGAGSVSVQWQLPDNSIESPISSNRLSPYTQSTTTTGISYSTSGNISLSNVHNITISGKSISGGTTPCIFLSNCYNIHITGNKLYNSSDVGIHLYKCRNITIDNNYFTKVSSGVYAEQTTAGGIIVNSNQFLNMVGPFPRGQFIQFNNVSGPGSSISDNKGENILGQSYPEDAISLYQSNGTASSPIIINGNWIRGGGPSASGGGIMLGDNGGSYETASNNILVNPGEYGMAIAGGDHNSLLNNFIYGSSQSFTNVGLYVNSINGYAETNTTVSGNSVLFYNSSNYKNNCWLAPNINKPAGWDTLNIWGADISTSLLPKTIITGD
jgi:parallel beta-helix repeat protein